MTQIRRRKHKPHQTSSRKSAVNKSAADSSRKNKVKMILLRRGHIFYSAWEEQREREGGGESVRQINRAGRTDEGRVNRRWELTKPCKTLQNGKIDTGVTQTLPPLASHTRTHKKNMHKWRVCMKDVCMFFMHWKGAALLIFAVSCVTMTIKADCGSEVLGKDNSCVPNHTRLSAMHLNAVHWLCAALILKALARFAVTGSEDSALTTTLSSSITAYFTNRR